MNIELFRKAEKDIEMLFSVDVESLIEGAEEKPEQEIDIKPEFLCSLEFVYNEEGQITRRWVGKYDKEHREDIKKGIVAVLNAIHQAGKEGVDMDEDDGSDALLSIVFLKNPITQQLSLQLLGAQLVDNVKENLTLGIMEQILTLHNEHMAENKIQITMKHNTMVEPIDYSVGV